MTPDAGTVVFTALLLILPIAALAARRLPVGATIRMALAWIAIFAVAYAVVVLWQDAGGDGMPTGSQRP